MTYDKRFAKDVATHLDRKRTGRRVVALTGLAGAAALAIMYLRCGKDFGLGTLLDEPGAGTATATQAAVDAGATRCAIRVTADGVTVNGAPATIDAAVAACKATPGADVVVTGDARQGDWDALRAALEGAGVAIFAKQR